MSNTYQKDRRPAQPDWQPGEIAVPEQVIVSMAEIAESANEGLLAVAVGAGLQVMAAMFGEDADRLCGPGSKHNPDRAGYRHGTEAGSVTLGGRRIPVTRPRVRAADGSGELHLPAYDLFSSTEILGRLALEKTLAGLSSRRYGAGLEPAGAAVQDVASATSKSAVSRRFVAATETALAELMSRDLSGLDLVAFMVDGGALPRAHLRRGARHRHRRGQAPARGGGGLDRERRRGHGPDHRAARPRPGHRQARPLSGTLNTGLIDPSELGDIGDGVPDAFNVVIEALDQNGNFAFEDETLTLGSTYNGSISSAIRGVQPVSGLPTLSGDAVVLHHNYRYVPVEPDNVAPGMQGVDTLTKTSSTAKQTQVNEAVIAQNGGISQGSMHLEEKDRSVTAPWKHMGPYHKWLWASYKFVEYRICAQNCGGTPAAEWRANLFTGDFGDCNPNFEKSGESCAAGTCQSDCKITYNPPNFVGGPEGEFWFALTNSNSGWSRDSGTREQNNVGGTFVLPFASSLGVNSLTEYGSITTLTYNYESGCGDNGDGHKRIIWGDNVSPTVAKRVQASCLIP